MRKKSKSSKSTPYYLPNELYAFDILIKFERGKQPSLHYDEQMQQVFNTLAEEHEVFLLKINWSDPSLHLIIPPQDLMHLFTDVPQPDAVKEE